jgi:hypothetical protein
LIFGGKGVEKVTAEETEEDGDAGCGQGEREDASETPTRFRGFLPIGGCKSGETGEDDW